MQNNLKILRKAKGFVLWHFATVSGVNTSLISAIEKHGYLPSVCTRKRIATALGVEISTIWPEISEKGGD